MNEPELRFKADDGSEFPEWEEKKLSDICDINPSPKTLDDVFYYIDLDSISDGSLSLKEPIIKEDAPSRAQRTLSVGDVLFQSVRPYQKNHYYFKKDLDKQTVASTGFDQLRMKRGDNRFLYQILFTDSFCNEVDKRCTGSNYPAINSTDLSEIKMNIPCVIEEQRKIADLFSTLDNVIDSVQKEVDSWEQMKRGVMQKLFSQEVRFKADDGSEFPEWGKVKLSDVTYYSKDKIDAKDIMTEEYVSTDTMLQNFAGIKTSETVPTSATLCSFQIGDILMADIRPYLKKIWLADMDGACNSDVLVIRPKNGINPRFIYDCLTQDSFIAYVMSSAKGSKMPRGDKKMIMNYEIPDICFEEQQKIADCLSEFDSVIEKTKQKLEAYKQLKKGLMQRMFV